MNTKIEWLKRNWMLLALTLIVIYFLTRDYLGVRTSMYRNSYDTGVNFESVALPSAKSINPIYTPQAAPVAQIDRMVVQDTDVSLLVDDVAGSIKTIESSSVALGGYMVNKYLNQPEGAATGSITVRVPVEKRETALENIRKAGVRVVSENVNGNDVTDQYVDLQENINQLEKTKAKMQSIMDQATRVSDLVEIQNQLNNIQRQIDNNKGQQKYLEQTAKLTRITVNLSTDELALPYTPDEAWRPEAVFKNAVRAMVQMLRFLASGIIWVIVFLPLIALLAVMIWIVDVAKKRMKSTNR